MSERLVCPHCGASFRSPATYADHVKRHEKQPATQMLTRKLADKMAKKRKAIPNDISRDGVFPQAESVEERMEQIRSEIYWLKEAHKPHVEMVVGAVRSALKSKRLKGKHAAFWAKKYAI